MTTILADARLGVMVADSNVSDGVSAGRMRKVWRIKGNLYGLSGQVAEFEPFLDWVRSDFEGDSSGFSNVAALGLMLDGRLIEYTGKIATPVQCGRSAVGSGSLAAMAAHEALNYEDPRKAVRIACNHDAKSRGPVRLYQLKGAA
jgi:ATP-dependent protease HslVU (ClpYQ) peptidase subunit